MDDNESGSEFLHFTSLNYEPDNSHTAKVDHEIMKVSQNDILRQEDDNINLQEESLLQFLQWW